MSDRPPFNKGPESVAELLERYARVERYFQSTRLPEGADLREVTLDGSHFEEGFLHTADFRGANLRGVRFNCNIKCSDFAGADLTDASFEGAWVEATIFEGAILNGTRFAGAYYMGYAFLEGEYP